jgi:hypothetical protein
LIHTIILVIFSYISQLYHIADYFILKIMPMKPIPLAAFCADFIPPVTGVNGNLAPVANAYDSSGNFDNRPRIGSLSKKRRIGEIDDIFDLSKQYPPLVDPPRPIFDLKEIKTLLVTAAAAGEEIRPLLDSADTDPKLRAFGSLSIALLDVVSAMVEKGFMPLSGSGAGSGSAGSGAGLGGGRYPSVPPPPPPKSTPPGLKELRECLEKSDIESVLFDADLGQYAMGNRTGLNNAFSDGIRKLAIQKATESGKDPAEAVRAMNDALGCVTSLDFVGIRSEPIKIRENSNQPNSDCHTMPVKLRFEDRNSRLHFEQTIKNVCGLRATMSFPKPLREEQAVFLRAVKERYPGRIVTARPDVSSLRLVAFHKLHGEGKWQRCIESVPIPHGITLPGYNVRKEIALPPVVAEPLVGSDSSQMESDGNSGSQEPTVPEQQNS